MTYNVHKADYFRPDLLNDEILRIFDICHGCRLCFNLCPSFPTLFDAIDRHDDAGHGEVDALDETEIKQVIDLCYNCKLCFPKCPYTPPHKYNLDFPRLMLRAKAVQAAQKGIPIQDRFLSRPDIVGKIGSWSAPIANAVTQSKIGRIAMEKTVGLHRDFNLPEFSKTTFSSWFKSAVKKHPLKDAVTKVALFGTCSVEHNTVATGRAMAEILWHNGIKIVMPEQVCCGMPSLDGGMVEACTRQARTNVASFAPWVDRGYDIVIPGPTCSCMFKHDYGDLVDTQEARRVASKTYDLGEYLMGLHGRRLLKTDFVRGFGKIGYHLPCHLKVQNMGTKSRDLLALLPNTTVEVVDKCAAVDGTWGMKTEYFELSQTYAKKLYKELDEHKADLYATDCPMARQQIIYGTGRPAYHPIEILRDAYGLPQ